MPSTPTALSTALSSLKIEIAEDGTASLSGINTHDLKQILLSAILEGVHSPVKPMPLTGTDDEITAASNLEAATGHLWRRAVLDALEVKLDFAVRREHAPQRGQTDGIEADYALDLAFITDELRMSEREPVEALVANLPPAQQSDPMDEVRARLNEVLAHADAALRALSPPK